MSRRRKPDPGNQLLEKGVLAIFVGCALLLGSMLLGNSPFLRPIAQGLRTPGWLAIVLGVALLGIHRAIVRKRVPSLTLVQENQRRDAYPGSSDPYPAAVSAPPGSLRHALDRPAAPKPSPPSAARGGKQQRWTKQVFSDIEWRRFEAVCEGLFAQAGFEAKSQSHGADGGVDIWLYSKNAEGPVAVVQCKHWAGAVGVKEVREFFGVMASKGLKRGTFATSSTYTSAAIDFAKENGISTLDGNALLTLIARRSEQQQQDLLATAYEGEYWRPTCASCGVKLVERVSGKDGSGFWGCANYPRCRTKIRAKAAG
jgi:restriction system protein